MYEKSGKATWFGWTEFNDSYLGLWKSSTTEYFYSPQAVRSWNYQSTIVYHLIAFTTLSSSAIITRLSGTNIYVWNLFHIQEKWFIQSSLIFSSLKCQVSSFHPACCLLSFTEWTVCLGMCFQGLLSFLFSNQICNPVPRVMIYVKYCVGPNRI